jgi:serralysin
MYQSGDERIDTLLSDFEPHWNGNGRFNEAASVSFSFVNKVQDYNFTPGIDGDLELANFSAFSAAQKQAARDALQAWANVANLTFTEVADSVGSHGNIRLMNSTDVAPAAGLAFFPATFAGNKNFFEESGDVYIDPTSFGALDFSEHGFGRHLILHETGHALGLTHPNEVDSLDTIPAAQQTDRFTVMTTTANGGVRVFEAAGVFSTGPMLFDILAIQHLYGANMSFRTGNTTYAFDDSDIVYETIWDAGGTDTISVAGSNFRAIINLNDGTFSSIVRSPDGSNAAGVDNLAIAFGAKIENAIGGDGNDRIIGNEFKNTIDGAAGNDSLTGGGGPDSLDGGAGTDSLSGGGGNDRLAGGSGADSMNGGPGDDTFVTDSAGDIVQEASGGGTDTIRTSVDRTLPDEVENGLATGTGGVDIVGNAKANTIEGNSGANTLDGLGGSDVLSGGGGDDVLSGGSGDDTLNGGGGADSLAGGLGDDVYLARAGDTLSEAGGGGTDRAQTFADLVLPAGIENASASGGGDIDVTGNSLANRLTGNAGVNTLSGLGGGDILQGGGGSDRLSGGPGLDVFLYRALSDGRAIATNVARGGLAGDTVTDFVSGSDVFRFRASAFDPDGAIGLGQLTLGDDFSVIAGPYDGTDAGANANFAADQATFVFSTGDSTLYFDGNGDGAGYTVIATLANGAVLAATDIEVVA